MTTRRNRILLFLTLALVGAFGSAAAQGDGVRDYLEAKARYSAQYRGRSDSVARIGVAAALKDLERRARAAVGAIDIRGKPLNYTLTWVSWDDAHVYVYGDLVPKAKLPPSEDRRPDQRPGSGVIPGPVSTLGTLRHS